MNTALRTLLCMLPIAIVVTIWFPVAEHYYVPTVRIPESSLQVFLEQPSDATLEVLGDQFLGARVTDATDLPGQSPEGRLRQAGLFRVGMDLARFEKTGEASQFEAIADFVVDFSRRANGRFSYDEFLWNDHAIANRIFVLAKFWGHYRRHPSFEPDGAREVLEHVAKNVQFLLRDDHFTYWSNHGIMQSLALLHAANAFPAMPGRSDMVETGLDRLSRQLEFFVSDSGWVMEHSAGYQEFGSNLLATLLVELEVLGKQAPPEWQSKARKSRRILDWLTRPDGSIPNFGDSYSRIADVGNTAETCDGRSLGVMHSAEGYFVAWDVRKEDGSTSCAQTTVVWASFISNAHKRPNELSVHYWFGGVDYSMSSGYWPYGDPDRLEAIGWRGSNAPHVSGESGKHPYSVHHQGACLADNFRFVDLERRGMSDGSTVRRQVVDLGIGGVLLLDSGEGQADKVRESVWRIDPRVTLIAPDGRRVQAGLGEGDPSHLIRVDGAKANVEALSRVYAREGFTVPDKFSAVAARDPIPTYVVTSPIAEPTLIALTPGRTTYRLDRFDSPERWRVEDDAARLVVERSGALVRVTVGAGESSSQCEVALGALPDEPIRSMEASFLDLAEDHSIFKAWTFYRLKASVLVAALFAAQLGTFVCLSMATGRRFRYYTEAALLVGWLGLGAYLTLIYLAP